MLAVSYLEVPPALTGGALIDGTRTVFGAVRGFGLRSLQPGPAALANSTPSPARVLEPHPDSQCLAEIIHAF